jgi:hypothetical protein
MARALLSLRFTKQFLRHGPNLDVHITALHNVSASKFPKRIWFSNRIWQNPTYKDENKGGLGAALALGRSEPGKKLETA